MAEAPTSVVSEFKMGVQTNATTPNTTKLICGRMTRSSLLPQFTELAPGAEHGCGFSGRPTMQKSKAIRTSYVTAFGGTWFLYPDMLGVVLRGMGFKDTPAIVGAGPEYDHVFTIDSRTNHAWLTVLKQVDEGAAAFEHRTTGARVASLDIAGTSRGIVCSMGGVGMSFENSAGTEVSQSESDYLLTATDGTITATVGGSALFSGNPRAFRFNITNPLYLEEPPLLTPQRSTLPALGMAVGFQLGGIDLDKSLWDKMMRNGASTGSPSLVIPEMALNLKVESVDDIPGGSSGTPYSMTIDIPSSSVRMTPYMSSGRNLIRVGINGVMVDEAAGTEPITITIRNKETNTGLYAGAA